MLLLIVINQAVDVLSFYQVCAYLLIHRLLVLHRLVTEALCNQFAQSRYMEVKRPWDWLCRHCVRFSSARNAYCTGMYNISTMFRLTDGIDVLYNKFNVSSSSPPDNPPQHPNSDYNCVVATTGQWRVSRCDERHRVVCQSDTLTGIMTICLHQVIHSCISWVNVCVLEVSQQFDIAN